MHGSRLPPTTDLSLTIPASASNVISVGAYNGARLSVAPFSGKGSTSIQKPDLVAPGVDILAANASGGYRLVSGTSFATPFVASAAANLMQWGITDGNDSFLYGARVKAYLINAARALPGSKQIPNPSDGWGRLCANASVPIHRFCPRFPVSTIPGICAMIDFSVIKRKTEEK